MADLQKGRQNEKDGDQAKYVLILEDDADIRGFIVLYLKRAGYSTIETGLGREAIDIIKKNPNILIALLDVMLPDISGIEVCHTLRAYDPRLGIIMLTAKTQSVDVVNGLMNGADDYVTKPFAPAELTARVDALWRRLTLGTGDLSEIVSGPFKLDVKTRSLTKRGEQIRLTQTEFMLIKLFMDSPGKALSREEILLNVWGSDSYVEPKIADVNIRRLRQKIEDDSDNPSFISTVWGYGYRWDAHK